MLMIGLGPGSGGADPPGTDQSAPLNWIEEAARQLSVCNSCRYCEAYCPVFPAVERHPDLKPAVVISLANLCHDCQACYQACMYVPPHEFAIDLPAALTAVREETYASVVYGK